MAKDNTEIKIEKLLEKGLSKKEIKRRLKGSVEDSELDFFLKNTPYPQEKQRYLFLNISLFAILLVVTLKKLYFALSFGQFGLVMLMALVVPTVNLYLLREIMRFRRLGYQFCLILSTLSLINAENRAFPEIVLVPLMILLSGFMYWQMFLKHDRELKETAA
ncbi:MAG: hypothetical protein DSZ23_05080 [Thermodesulfatator sp.]|nr:MAG: hypothetical protein DSZ23_05080 [Thermodesulfatator sp.]